MNRWLNQEILSKIILVGGSGYIGTKLTEILYYETDYNLVIIDRLDFKLNPDFRKKFYEDKRIQFFQHDMRDTEFLNEIIFSNDIVINLAALVGEPLCKLKPEEAVSVNFDAAVNLANICKEKKVDKLIQLSTCSNYGQAKESVNEDGELHPTSLYAETKVDLEKYLLENIPNSIILRCATAYGVSQGRMRFDLLLSDFIKEAWLDKKISVYMPQVHRPIVHIYDISQAIKKVIESKNLQFQVFNVGSNDQNYTKKEIAEKVANSLNVNLEIVEREDKRDYVVNFDRIYNELDFIPKYKIDFGVSEMIDILKDGKFDLEQANV